MIDDTEVDAEQAANTGAIKAMSIEVGLAQEEARISQCADKEDEQDALLALLWFLQSQHSYQRHDEEKDIESKPDGCPVDIKHLVLGFFRNTVLEPCLAMPGRQQYSLCNKDGSVKGASQASADIDGNSKPPQGPKDLKVHEKKGDFGEEERQRRQKHRDGVGLCCVRNRGFEVKTLDTLR